MSHAFVFHPFNLKVTIYVLQGRNFCTWHKAGKYPIFRIPPDTSISPHFSNGYLDTNFFINGPIRKLVTPQKNGGNGNEPKWVPFSPIFP